MKENEHVSSTDWLLDKSVNKNPKKKKEKEIKQEGTSIYLLSVVGSNVNYVSVNK